MERRTIVRRIPEVVHVIEATHWDREWRFPFEATRIRLVQLMDRLLDIVEQTTARRVYHLDGQSIVLEDYLEVRPENARRLRAACRAGKILVGPWYTLPEENLVLGESLVRNLLVARQVCRPFGGPMPVGYTPTSYGQVSQMPQILSGMGIKSILFYRGVNNVIARQTEFWWEGPDGSRVLAFRFSDYGRANFFHLVYRPLVHNRDRSRQEHRWEEGGVPFRLAGAPSVTPYELIRPVWGWYPENAEAAVTELFAELRDHAMPVALGMQTQDSLEPYPHLPRLIAMLNERVGRPCFILSSLPEYVRAVQEQNPTLETITGEMRHTQKTATITDLFPHVFPTRPYVKQANRIAELELSRWAEPACAWAWLLGRPYPTALLTRAWKLLLANHAHDSISGCSMDAVHEDTQARNRQVRILATEQTILGLGHLAASIDGRAFQPEDVLLIVFNPAPRPRSEVVSAELDVHADESFETFELLDENGRPSPVQLRGDEQRLTIFQHPYELPLRMRTRSFRFYFQADGVPALGYKTWLLRRGGTASVRNGSMAEGLGILSNGLIRVEVNPNGTWNLTDMRRGRRFDHLGLLEDDGEVGDPWVRYAPKEDRLVTSQHCRAEVKNLEDGWLSASLRVRFPFRVPCCAVGWDQKRSEEEIDLWVEHELTVRRGSPRLDIATRVDNRARDHRLRIAFPTGIRTALLSAAETPFDVVLRPIALPDTTGWREPASGCHPHLGFVDVSDGQDGLALLNLGIPQYEVRDDEARTLVLTLMRCFAQKNTVRRADYPDQPGSQCLFPLEFRYALLPHAGNWEAADVLSETYAFLLPLRVAQAGRSPDGTLPRTMSFFDVEPAILQLSALKQSEDGRRLIMRLWNPSEREVEGILRCFRRPRSAVAMTLAEEPIGRLPIRHMVVRFRAGPKRVVTLGLRFG